MNLTKKLTTLFLTAAFVISASITAFATPNDDTIAALRNAKVPETYIIQAENYLKTRTLTPAESTAVITQITKASNVLKTAGTNDMSTLSTADKNELISYVTAAGNAIDLNINVTKQANGQFLIIAKDKDGKTVANFASNEVKQTGLNNSVFYIGALILILAIIFTSVIRRSRPRSKV